MLLCAPIKNETLASAREMEPNIHQLPAIRPPDLPARSTTMQKTDCRTFGSRPAKRSISRVRRFDHFVNGPHLGKPQTAVQPNRTVVLRSDFEKRSLQTRSLEAVKRF